MKLKLKNLQDTSFWEKAGVKLPLFDIEKVKEATMKNPEWLHFGAGNIFRAFIARIHQDLLNKNISEKGIIAVETFDYEVIDRIYHPYDNLSLTVQMDSEGNFDKTVVASVVSSLTTSRENGDFEHLKTYFANPSLKMTSYTITEKGYALQDVSGKYFPVILQDIANGPEKPVHVMSVTTALLLHRFKSGAAPLTLVSMDNCSHNGEKLNNAVITIAEEWVKGGFAEQSFLDYLKNDEKVYFPFTMIDKITPRPDDGVKEALKNLGMEEIEGIITSKNTYMAPFVNAEVSEYLVIEDKFPNGRPALEKCGVLFTDRATVNNVETMKVTTCLNPLHTALAVSGCVLGFTSIWEEMADPLLKKLVMKIGYDEGLPVVINPGILNPEDFINEVVTKRFTNPFIPDTPQRIASDTSQKVGIRFGETIKSYMKDPDLDPSKLIGIPLAIATWCRYLIAIDDNGKPFTLSPDPMTQELQEIVKSIKLGVSSGDITPILNNQKIFGCDLAKAGLDGKIQKMFNMMIAGPGALRTTLESYLKD
jgi:fructuronate reductase